MGLLWRKSLKQAGADVCQGQTICQNTRPKFVWNKIRSFCQKYPKNCQKGQNQVFPQWFDMESPSKEDLEI